MTPTPWHNNDGKSSVVFYEHNRIVECPTIEEATSIVKAINNHNKLVEALQNIATRSEGNDSFVAADVNALAKLALSQANTQQQEKTK